MRTERRQYVILALGVSVCLIGALVMVVGESIFGERNSGVATLIGIVGICIIGSFNRELRQKKAEMREA